MLGLSLEQTRIYQEAKAEGREEGREEQKLEQTRIYQEAKAEGREEGRTEGREEREAEMLKVTVPLLLKTGMSKEQIAQHLNVDLEAVQQAAQQNT